MNKRHFERAPEDIADLIRNNQLPTNRSPSKAFQTSQDIPIPTCELRVYLYKEDGKVKHKIQQLWKSDDGDQWRDLPVVKEWEE